MESPEIVQFAAVPPALPVDVHLYIGFAASHAVAPIHLPPPAPLLARHPYYRPHLRIARIVCSNCVNTDAIKSCWNRPPSPTSFRSLPPPNIKSKAARVINTTRTRQVISPYLSSHPHRSYNYLRSPPRPLFPRYLHHRLDPAPRVW